MTSFEPADQLHELAVAAWRKSSFSGDQGACVEAAPLRDDLMATRNGSRPKRAWPFTRIERDAWIRGAKAGEFDDLGVVR